MMRYPLSLLLASSLMVGSSFGAVVLTIDISNPTVTVFTAVANNSQSNDTVLVDYGGGIAIRDFFVGNESITVANPVVFTGNWTARGTTSSYNETVTFTYGNANPVPARDLSVYYNVLNAANNQVFVTSAAPFTGSSTADFSDYANLPAVGATGDVFSDYQNGVVLGQWVVIPEPSTAFLGAIGALALLRRRR